MYFIANLQPRLNDINKVSGFLTYNEKKKIINEFEENKLNGKELYLCDEHGGGNKPGFQLSKNQHLGKVNDMIINQNGDLMINCEMFNNEKYKKMKEEMLNKTQLYGVSVWIDLQSNPDTSDHNNLFLKKQLSHVAITIDPGLGDYGAYIHEWGENKLKIDNIFKDTHYKFSEKKDFWDIFTDYDHDNLNNINIDHPTSNNLKYAPNRLLNEWNNAELLSQGNFYFILIASNTYRIK